MPEKERLACRVMDEKKSMVHNFHLQTGKMRDPTRKN